MDLKQAAISMSMMVFVLSSMLGMGLGLRVRDIVAPLRSWRLVMVSLLANFVVMPFAALALAKMLRLDESMGIGLLLLGLAGGAPFLPKLAQIAKGNLAFAVGLMVLLMVVTVGYLPLVLPMLLPGVSVSPAHIARSLVLLMLLPLGSALAVNANRPDIAARVKGENRFVRSLYTSFGQPTCAIERVPDVDSKSKKSRKSAFSQAWQPQPDCRCWLPLA